MCPVHPDVQEWIAWACAPTPDRRAKRWRFGIPSFPARRAAQVDVQRVDLPSRSVVNQKFFEATQKN